MAAEALDSIDSVDPDAWDRLAGTSFPFLRHAFLAAAERSGCVAPATGWEPCHLVLRAGDGSLRAAMPLYRKSHSWGEFVFDWSWAEAYRRSGLAYYPKLVSAVPFTPAPSSRLLLADDADRGAAAELLDTARELAHEQGLSSVHVLFPTDAELPALRAAGFAVRKDCQFHWHNGAYASFDDFLGTFSSAKRKKVRRERRYVREQGIRFRWLAAGELDEALWSEVYRFISYTFMKRGAVPYLNRDFFVDLSRELPEELLVVLAEHAGRPIAAAVFYRGAERLYGRYWGSDADYHSLHFETCYYQGIEYCIDHGLSVFEPGTQGEHKISRGFSATPVWSAHWLAHPALFDAIGTYLRQERREVDRYMAAVDSHSPYRELPLQRGPTGNP